MYKFLFHLVAYILTLFTGITIGSTVMLLAQVRVEEEKAAEAAKTDTAS